MITTTLKDIHLAAGVIEQLATIEWPAKLSYKIGKLARLVLEESKEYDKLRFELIKKVGTSRDATQAERASGSGDKIYNVIGDDKIKEFNEKMKEIESISVEISWDVITLESLGDVKIPAIVMRDMNDFISE